MGSEDARPPRRGPGWIFYAASLLIAGVSGLTGGYWLDAKVLAPQPSPAAVAAVGSPPPAAGLIPTLTGPMTMLFMATDVDIEYRGGKRVFGLRGNTDTMIAARFDPGLGQVRLLSIPRDTRVPIPGHGTFKINAANPYGGPPLATQVVGEFLGTPIDRFMLVNTRGVIQVVDALGGVNVFVPKPMHYDDHAGGLHIHLDKGWNHLDGQHAHDFLRFRHDDQGDIGRVQRQQAFMQALMHQYLTPLNLLRTPQLLAVARENMVTDLTPEELMRLVGWGKDLHREQIEQAMVPGREAIIRGGWYWEADPAGTRRMVDEFLLAGTPAELRSPADTRVTVLDGVGDRGAARELRKTLLAAGYGAVELGGPAPEPDQARTEIIAQTADEAGAKALQLVLGVGAVTVAATGAIGTDFTVVMGRDWVQHAASQQVAEPTRSPASVY